MARKLTVEEMTARGYVDVTGGKTSGLKEVQEDVALDIRVHKPSEVVVVYDLKAGTNYIYIPKEDLDKSSRNKAKQESTHISHPLKQILDKYPKPAGQ